MQNDYLDSFVSSNPKTTSDNSATTVDNKNSNNSSSGDYLDSFNEKENKTPLAIQSKENEAGPWENMASANYKEIGKTGDTYGPSPTDVGLGIAGAAAGPFARSAMDQKNVYGTPEYNYNQAANLGGDEKTQSLIDKASVARDTLNESNIQHKATHDTLSNQLSDATDAHLKSTDALEQLQHEKIALDAKSIPSAPLERPPLIETPLGGPGTEKYAIQFGQSAPEAKNALSMSSVQSDIPKTVENYKKLANVSPGYRPVSGLNTLINTSDPAHYSAAQDVIQHNNASAFAQQADDIATSKAKAINQMQLETAKANAAGTSKQLQDAQKNLNSHISKAPISPSDLASSRAAITAGEQAGAQASAKAAARGTVWGGIKAAGNAIGKVAGRINPIVGAVTAPIEAYESSQDYNKGNYGRAAIHGLGALGGAAQVSGNPLAMAAGDVAQIPSAVMSGLDAYRAYRANNP